jgi:hypothetical protein
MSPEEIDAVAASLRALWRSYGQMLDAAPGAERYGLKVRRHYIREYIVEIEAGRVPRPHREAGEEVGALFEPLLCRSPAKQNREASMTGEQQHNKSRKPGSRIGRLKSRHADTTIGALRPHLGRNFAKGSAENETLSNVLHKLDEPSLTKLLDNYESGKLKNV